MTKITHWKRLDIKSKKYTLLAQGNPYFTFPFFSNLFSYWQYFFYTLNYMRKQTSWVKVLVSPSLYAQLFFLWVSSLGLLIKGGLSLIIRLLRLTKHPSGLQPMMVSMHQKYIEHMTAKPWYSFDYHQEMVELYEYTEKKNIASIHDLILFCLTITEYALLSLFAVPIEYILESEGSCRESIVCHVRYTQDNTHREVMFPQQLHSGLGCHQAFKRNPFWLCEFDQKSVITVKVNVEENKHFTERWYRSRLQKDQLLLVTRSEWLVTYALEDEEARKDLHDMMQDLRIGEIEAIL